MKKLSDAKDELLGALKPFRNAFITVGVFSFFINLMMLAPSLYMMQVYDRVLGSRNETTLLALTLLILGLYGLNSLLESVRSIVLVRVSARLDMALNSRIFTAAYERNLARPGSNPVQALNDLGSLRQTLTGSALLALFDAPWLPVYLFVIFVFEPALGWFSVIGAVILVVLGFNLVLILGVATAGRSTEDQYSVSCDCQQQSTQCRSDRGIGDAAADSQALVRGTPEIPASTGAGE